MLKITATTSDHAIETATKSELMDIATFAGARSMKKSELVAVMKEARDRAKKIADNQAAKEAAHKAQVIEFEKGDDKIQNAKQALVEGLTKEDAARTSIITEFQTKVSGLSTDATYEIRWHAANVQKADAERQQLQSLLNYCVRQLEEPTETLTEFQQHLDDMFDMAIDRVISWTLRLNPSDMAELEGHQYLARVLRCVCKYFREDVENGTQNCRYMYVR